MQLIRYPFSYMDIQTTLLYCLYIYRYKVKWIAGDGVLWKYLICLYWLWLITSLYCLYICKRYKVKWCKGDGLVMWQIFSSFRCKKIILLILMRWVQTTPSFLFFGSPCLRHRVLHNGSSCQLPDGKPSAPRSTSGYSAKRACILSRMSFPGDMILRKYLMMHMSK